MRRHAKASSAGSTSAQAGGLGSLRLRILALLCITLAAAMALFASSAFAAETRSYTGTSFGPDGAAGTEAFSDLQSIAVDQAGGDVYAYDAGAGGKVYKFDSAGEPVAFSGLGGSNAITGIGGVTEPGAEQVAVAPPGSPGGTAGDIYVTNLETVKVYSAAGLLLGTLGEGETCGVAVNPAGHVFIGSYPATIREYVPAANPPANTPAATGSVPGLGLCNVAADGSGNAYATDYGTGSKTAKLEGLADTSPTFIEPGGNTIGLDPISGDLFVDRRSSVAQYDPGGALTMTFGGGQISDSFGVAVNSGADEAYVADGGSGKVDIFGAPIAVPGVSAEPATGVTTVKAVLNATINPAGVAVEECKFEYGTTEAYGSTKACEGAIPTDENDHPVTASLSGLTPQTKYFFRAVATNANGTSSAAGTFETGSVATTEPATAVTTSAATLNGVVRPGGEAVAECFFEWGETAAYGQTAPCAGPTPADEGEHPVSARIEGLSAAGAGYHFRLVVEQAGGESTGTDHSFRTHGALLSKEGALEVGLTEATLAATINPRGAETSYHIEYGPDTDYGSSTPELNIGSAEQPSGIEETLTGLSQATTYHWRVVATSEGESVSGPDLTFHTFAPSPAPQTGCPNQEFRLGAGALLPDCRAYEQATPVNKHGSNSTTNVNITAASADGNRIDFGNAAGLPSTGGSTTAAPYLAGRSGGTWSTNGILPTVPAGSAANTLGWDEEFKAVASFSETEGLFLADTENRTFEQLISVSGERFSPALGAFAADPKHFVIEAENSLAPGAVAGKPNVFDIDHGAVTLTSRIPQGPATSCDDAAGPACEPAPGGAYVGPYAWGNNLLVGQGAAHLRYLTQNTISKDGSKTFFTTAGNGQLYVRENGTTTRLISASQASVPDPNGTRPAAFMAATPDGRIVYFTSCEKLTDDSTAVSTAADSCYEREEFGNEGYVQGSDLYAYDTSTHTLTDLSVDDEAGDAKGAQVVGMLGATPDGSYVYFVANGRLAPGTTAGNCARQAEPGQQCNIYVSHDGTISFVARIGESVQDGGDWQPKFNERAKESRVAADGTLLFSSVQNLTGYESVPSGSACNSNQNGKCAQYYRYVPETSELDCVSCSPADTIPTGFPSLSHSNSGFFTERPKFAFLTRGISADGDQVFFDTPDKLVAADTNGVTDAYEWEALGSGSCETEEVEGGCLYLLSTGKSDRNSYIGDISTDGDSAFIFTGQPLVPTDLDQIVDAYAVRTGGGLSSQFPPAAGEPCLGEACRGAGTAAPTPATPGSSTFSGPGNEKAGAKKKCNTHSKKCKKQKKKSKNRKKHKSKKHTHSHNKAGGSK